MMLTDGVVSERTVGSLEFSVNVMPMSFTQPFQHEFEYNTTNQFVFLSMGYIHHPPFAATDMEIYPHLVPQYRAWPSATRGIAVLRVDKTRICVNKQGATDDTHVFQYHWTRMIYRTITNAYKSQCRATPGWYLWCYLINRSLIFSRPDWCYTDI